MTTSLKWIAIDLPRTLWAAHPFLTNLYADKPAALWTHDAHSTESIESVNDSAERLGLAPGMSASQALRCSPNLLLHYANSSERAAPTALIEAAANLFSETVLSFADYARHDEAIVLFDAATPRPDVLTAIGVKATVENVHRALVTELERCGIDAAIGIGATPELALAAARWTALGQSSVIRTVRDLEQAPLTALPLEKNTITALFRLGLRTAGDGLELFSVNPGRFSPDEQRQLNELAGLANSRFDIVKTSTQATLQMTLPNVPCRLSTKSKAALFTARGEFAARVSLFVRAFMAQNRRSTSAALSLKMADEAGTVVKSIALNIENALSADDTQKLIDKAAFEGGIWMQAAFLMLEVKAQKLCVTRNEAEIVLHREDICDELDPLAAKLSQIAGLTDVFRLKRTGSAAPEEAQTRAEPLATVFAGGALHAKPLPVRNRRHFPNLLPTQILPQPQMLPIENGFPTLRGPLRLLTGAERSVLETKDGQTERDYYIAQSQAGEMLWIFRDCRHGDWYLQGRFA